MKRFSLVVAVFFVALLLAGSQAVAAQESNFNIVEAKIRALVPNAEIIAVSETPVAGILQVQINNDIVYMSDDGKYLLQGSILDVETRTNMTDQAKSVIRQELLADLDPAKQISFTPEEPSHEILVFTDLDCGYCRKLHHQIEGYKEQGIAIHYLAFPRAGVGSASFDKYVSVWCADDQKQALTLAKKGQDPEPLKCPNPVEDQYELGRKIGVTGTPALVTSSGKLIPGYMPPVQLRQRLDSLLP